MHLRSHSCATIDRWSELHLVDDCAINEPATTFFGTQHRAPTPTCALEVAKEQHGRVNDQAGRQICS